MESNESPILRGLNPAQYDAVVNYDAPSLIIAGAGSGKTRVLTSRIAYMIERFQSVRAITEQLALEGYRYFLMEDEGRAVGYCGVQPRDGRLFLSKVYLLHEARGQGRFRQMLEYLRGLCREVGARTIWLTVNRRNERAIGAYRRAGFREVRAQVTDIGGGYVMDDYVMELETTPQKE